jgi:hypothetical protein
VGWAIRRADLTYRAWYRNAQDDVLRPGETWEAFAEPPVITPDPLTPAQIDAEALREATQKAIKVTVIFYLRRELGRNPTAQEIQDARDEWIAIWKALG